MRRAGMPIAKFAVVVTLALWAVAADARAADPSGAVEELKKGYALRQQDRCQEAVVHFVASYQLDPKPKALLNLATCEERMGDLVAARTHFTQGRDLARQTNDAPLASAADEQLGAVEARLPRLTLELAAGAPSTCTVSRDGETVTAAALGVPIAVNPGRHSITVIASGYSPRTFELRLDETAHERLEVEPGERLEAEAPQSTPAPLPSTSPEPASEGVSGRRIAALAVAGLGAVGLAVGIGAGIEAGSRNAALQAECRPDGTCPASAQSDLDSFHSLRTWSTLGYVVGAAGMVGGAVLWLTAPSPSPAAGSPAAGLRLGPMSLSVTGSF